MRAAAADISFHAIDDFFAGWFGIFAKQPDRRHDHAGGAIRALKGFGLQKRFLNRMQFSVALQPFDGRDFLPNDRAERRLAGACRLAIEQHGAGATHAFTAAVFGSCEAEVLAENVEELGIGRNVDLMLSAVDG